MPQTQYIAVEENLKLWVETTGVTGNGTCLFISGAGAGSFFWSERLCQSLANRGFLVIRYDHRDFGYSDKIDFNKNPYDMMDLTRDAVVVLDSFDVKKAHIIGHSMGGFIAQLMAIHYPERVHSITSASSSTSSPEVPPPPERTWEIFMSNKPVNNLEQDLEGFLKVWKYLNGIAEFDEEMAMEYTRKLYERQVIDGPLGESHVKAQANMTDRSELLMQIDLPALIIHGREDYLVDPFGGIQTAECLKNSNIELIPQMGHMLFNNDIQVKFDDAIIKFVTPLS